MEQQSYRKLKRNRRGGSAIAWLFVGFFPGLFCGGLALLGLFITGVVGNFGAEVEPLVAVTEVVQRSSIIVTPEDFAMSTTPLVITATAQPSATVVPSITPEAQAQTANVQSGAAATIPPVTPLQPTEPPTFNVSGTVQGGVNIRYGPGADYARVGFAEAGDRFEIIGQHTQYDWVQIRYPSAPNGVAWMSLPLLTVEGDLSSVQQISTTVFNLPTLTPTPSVIQAVGDEAQDTAPLSPEFQQLGNALWQITLNSGFDPETSKFASLFLMDLQTGEAISFADDIAYSGTSVAKISILARLYAALEAPPNINTATDIANTMICSNNTSTNNLLEDISGGDQWQGALQVTDFTQALNMNNTFLISPFIEDPANPPVAPYPIAAPEIQADQTRSNPDLSNQTTVSDMGFLLSDMYQCAYNESGTLLEDFPGQYEPRECRQMIHVMASNTVDGLLKAGVPAETRVAHKHGWIADTHANAGIFFTPGGDYVLVMMLHSGVLDATGARYLAFTETLPAMAEVSRYVYNYYNPDAQLDAIREGFIPEAPSCNFANSPLITDLQQFTWNE